MLRIELSLIRIVLSTDAQQGASAAGEETRQRCNYYETLINAPRGSLFRSNNSLTAAVFVLIQAFDTVTQ